MKLFSFIFGDSLDDLDVIETKSFRIKYDGEALSGHTIDVNDLAPALMSLADLIQEANHITNKDDSSISIKVKATETGCFQISIQAVRTCFDGAVNLFSGPQISALVNVLTLVGVVGGGSTLLWIIKKLKNKKPLSVVPKDANSVEIEFEPGHFVTVSKAAWDMYQSRKIREAVYGVLKPIQNTGIEKVEFIDEQNVVETVNKDDLPMFALPEEIEEPLQELPLRDTYVNVIHMWFKAGNKWKFSEGESEWAAEITDQNFIESLLKGEKNILANDLLKVRVKQTQFKKGSSLTSVYEIVEILEQKRGAQQTNLL